MSSLRILDCCNPAAKSPSGSLIAIVTLGSFSLFENIISIFYNLFYSKISLAHCLQEAEIGTQCKQQTLVPALMPPVGKWSGTQLCK
ncbi:hypothetical protein DASB73_037550 [Starmerella bacillaris]|uniref:Uncharacterized protein n=1 Tax=Starmerella bacillaris TaxID=1247836 RepID=A0AAV5RPD7_STABA|nr:hypothetical protein DASB73_037550 [Starmerella bacillaris]